MCNRYFSFSISIKKIKLIRKKLYINSNTNFYCLLIVDNKKIPFGVNKIEPC